MGRVKKWFFRTFFSCIKKVRGKYSRKSPLHFCSNPRIIRENITFVEDEWLPIPSSNNAVNMDIDDYGRHYNDSMKEEEQDGEESVSFNEENSGGNHHQAIKEDEQILDSEEEEFSFWPWNESKEIDICIADKIFSQGRILPMGISADNKPRPKVQERFRTKVSHQRRKAQIQFSKISSRLRFRDRHQKMAFWRFLRVGLMTMPEFQVHTSSFAPRTFF